jgi:hypothetical protein
MRAEIEAARDALHRLQAERALLLDRRDVAVDERRRLRTHAQHDGEASARLSELRELAVELIGGSRSSKIRSSWPIDGLSKPWSGQKWRRPDEDQLSRMGEWGW